MDAIGDIAVVRKTEAAVKSEWCLESALKKQKVDGVPEKSSDGSDGSNRSSITSEDLDEEKREEDVQEIARRQKVDGLAEKSSDGSNRSSITTEDLDVELLEGVKGRNDDGEISEDEDSEEDKEYIKQMKAGEFDVFEHPDDCACPGCATEPVPVSLDSLILFEEDEAATQQRLKELEEDHSQDYSHIEDEHLRELFKAYVLKYESTSPFDMDAESPIPLFGALLLLQPGDEWWEHVKFLTDLAVATEKDKRGSDWNLYDIRVVKANLRTFSFYITFDAKDSSSHQLQTYQTLVHHPPSPEYRNVEIFRLKGNVESAPQH